MPLSQNYNPKENESQMYQNWRTNNIGNPDSQKSKPNSKTHSILMPPPNLTGNMHAGHAFGHYVMDTLSRIARQNGQKDLWFPGVDHAGLQLEGVIDKMIKQGAFDDQINTEIDQKILDDKENLSKHLKKQNPELWLKLAWQKVNEWRDNQKNQASVLGDTPDYSRSLFTLDDKNIKMVNYAYLKYWEDGLIYKGSYLVNWSVELQTALSDVAGEIEYRKQIDPFVTFEYAIKSVKYSTPELASKYISIKLKPFSEWKRPKLSTVRPETKFTDIAIAMHPTKFEEYFNGDIFESFDPLNSQFLDDIRTNKVYVYFHLPSLHKGELKLTLTDKVEADFGTGVMKVTPAHDPFDYELCKELVTNGWLDGVRADACIGRDGKLTEEFCGEFAGMVAQEARGAIFKRLIETGFIPLKSGDVKEVPEFENVTDKEFWTWKQDKQYEFLKTNYPNHDIDWNYEHNVTICERTKTVVEPLISEEFFLSYHNEFQWKPVCKDDNLTIANSQKQTNLQKLGIEAVNKTNFYSEDYKERGINFLENIKDWCISRDLIWGHKMPVWYNTITNPDKTFFDSNQCQESLPDGYNLKNALLEGKGLFSKFQVTPNKPTLDGNWVQEEKILDTWFSSCLWPLSTLDYPQMVKNKESKTNIVLIHGGEAWQSKEEYRTKIQNGELNSYWYSSEFNNGFHGNKSSWKTKLSEFCKDNAISLIKPQMPNKTNADYIKWQWVFEKSLSQINSNTILIGHSLGSMFLTRYLSENKVDCKAVYLVSGGLNNEDISFNCPEDLENLYKMETKVKIVHSNDDKVVDPEDSYTLHRALPMAEFILTKGQGHLGGESEELLNSIINEAIITKATDFETFYPTQELLTAKEIFYQWIVRMTTVSYYFSGQIPYTDLIITPTVLDEKGKKMSKSLGNGLEPVAQIEKYSSDALRMAMLGGMIPNRNMKMGGRLADELCEKYRNFGNKMWNIARFFEYQESKFEEGSK
jgi:valyl-tRNA synthetase/predicted alpha/beta hydrolase family esterase